ncbi:hypothetical protein Tco_0892463 [Tanacetum coccineum]|uniref:Uncharacterized protein n=1 Tax=Tanacetum coccineum TaxID=301880 RepID=A0ABQ5C689_9ASTR
MPFSFRTIKVERLTVDKLFVVSHFHYRSSSKIGVPVGITSTCHGSSLCFHGCSKISNQLPDASKVMMVLSDLTIRERQSIN